MDVNKSAPASVLYPVDQPEAKRFLRELANVVTSADRIRLFYSQCGGEPGLLDCSGSPYDAWKRVLDQLASDGKLERFFELVRAEASLAGLRPLIEAIPWACSVNVYLRAFISGIRGKASLYSSLQGSGEIRRQDRAIDHDPAFEVDEDMHEILLQTVGGGTTKHEEYQDVLKAFDKLRRVVVLGEPGSGKSTTLRKLGLQLAEKALHSDAAPVPVFVELRDWQTEGPLESFLESKVPGMGRWNGRKRVLLLDGLNELPTGAGRGNKVQQIRGFRESGVFASCRKDDYTTELDLQCSSLRLAPFTPIRVRKALRLWAANRGIAEVEVDRLFWQLAGDERLAGVLQTWLRAGATEEEFWSVSKPEEQKAAYAKTQLWEDQLWQQHVPNPRSLLRLAENPYLLTMIWLQWRMCDKTLPSNRGSLVKAFVDSLFHREKKRAALDQARLVSGLTDLAWQMQTQDDSVVVSVSEEAALQALGGGVLLQEARAATLLDGGGGSEWRFQHQLLQEYFAARALEGRLGQVTARSLWPVDRWWDRNGWEEAVALLAGFGGIGKVVDWLAEAQPEVTARCVLESGNTGDKMLRERLHGLWMPRLLTDSQPAARAAVGRALGILNLDDRPGVGVLTNGVPDIEWVQIPACNFRYQDEKEPRRIATFEIARYPVTNAQFQTFVDAQDGYREERWWKGMDVPEGHRRAAAARWSEPNHPRETVSWYEAMAFCRWMSARTNSLIDLPTELEWERAAKGPEGTREFPWVGKFEPWKANTGEGGIGRTTPVGIYPEGRSAEGIEELAGNVWEWCRNEWDRLDRLDRTQPGGTEARALRGGSWFNYSYYARAVYRDFINPINRNFYFGFRVVRRSPITGH